MPTATLIPPARSTRNTVFDKKSARTIDAQGFLHVEACNISKACVNPYYGAEIPNHQELGLDPRKVYYLFRDPKELEKAAPTFNNLPLMDGHIEVSAFDLTDPKVQARVVGSTGTNALFGDPYLTNDIVVWRADAIQGVESKEQTELSCAYRYKLEMIPGAYAGQAYDGRMFDIAGNHVALVDEGRAGHDVTVKDSLTSKLKVELSTRELKRIVTDALRPMRVLLGLEKPVTGGITVDENPTGINQYSGGAASKAKEASVKANTASKAASFKGRPSPDKAEAHARAGAAHHAARDLHYKASRLSSGKQSEAHYKLGQAHNAKGNAHFAAHETNLLSHDSVTGDDNPEGINQYTGGSGGKEAAKEASRVANAATNHANKTGKKSDHMKAAGAHSDAQMLHQMVGNKKEAENHGDIKRYHMEGMKYGKDSITMDIEKREDVSPKPGKQKYGEVEFADPKNKKYPLDTPDHVRSAASYWGRPDNRSPYSKEDQTTISKRIEAAKKKFKIGEYAESK